MNETGDRRPRGLHSAMVLAGGLLALLYPAELFAQGVAAPTPDASAMRATPDSAATAPPRRAVPVPATTPQPQAVAAQVGTRIALRIQNPRQGAREKLNELGSDGEAEAVLTGRVHPFLKWQLGFLGSYGGPAAPTTASAALLDLVAKVEFADWFKLWLGRMPIPSDRTALSTEWAIATWTLPGAYDVYPPAPLTSSTAPQPLRPPPGPRRGDYDRGDGATLWGQVHRGRFKYYVGAFGLDRPEGTSPLYSARLALSLLDPEPGYYANSAGYGSKNVLALGVGAQHQAGGSLPPAGVTTTAANFNEVNVDLLFEMNGGIRGVLSLEGAFAKMWGANEQAGYQCYGLVGYLMPVEIGFGRFQPLVRIQHAGKGSAADAGTFTSIDAQLGYVIDGYHARLLGVYQYTRLPGETQNAILLGLQLLSRAR